MFPYPDLKGYLSAVADVAASVDRVSMEHAREMVLRAHEQGGTVFAAGNGGAGTVIDHFVLGLTLNAWRETKHGLRAVSLNANAAMLSAAANDFGRDKMFSSQLQALSKHQDDLVVALSSSGRSGNVAQLLRDARGMRLRSVVIVGRPGIVSAEATLPIVLGTDCAAVAEDVAIMLLHWLYGTFMVEGWQPIVQESEARR